jgi:A/G-specific adenine glycosylase
VLIEDGRVLLERRPPVGIWGGLLSLPEPGGEDAGEFAHRHGLRLRQARELPAVHHAFTHFRLTLRPCVCQVEVANERASEPGWKWLALDEIDAAALPAPVLRILRRAAAPA